jgi:hypothetical protein
VIVFGLSKIPSGDGVPGKVRGFGSLVLSFATSQVLLFYALLLWVSGRSLHKWQKVDDIRKEWKPEA